MQGGIGEKEVSWGGDAGVQGALTEVSYMKNTPLNFLGET